MRQSFGKFICAAALSLAATFGGAVTGTAADLVTIQVGYGAGGSYDMAARLVGRHLGRFLAGSPEVVVKTCRAAAA